MNYVKPLNLFKQVMKIKVGKPSESRRLLCLDVRDDCVCLAVSDRDNKTAMPLRTLTRDKSDVFVMSESFQSLVYEHNLSGFVVGLPYIRDNNDEKAKLLLNEVYENGTPHFQNILNGINYTIWDNSLSLKQVEYVTKEKVEMVLKHMNLHHLNAETIMDHYAVVGMLRNYLDYCSEACRGEEKLEATEKEEVPN
ncbi:hypothetical protein ACOSP7_013716 [Xanthoceras sorbifolium]